MRVLSPLPEQAELSTTKLSCPVDKQSDPHDPRPALPKTPLADNHWNLIGALGSQTGASRGDV